jgi:hypothetical protein
VVKATSNTNWLDTRAQGNFLWEGLLVRICVAQAQLTVFVITPAVEVTICSDGTRVQSTAVDGNNTANLQFVHVNNKFRVGVCMIHGCDIGPSQLAVIIFSPTGHGAG